MPCSEIRLRTGCRALLKLDQVGLGFVLELNREAGNQARRFAQKLDWELSCANGLGKELGVGLEQARSGPRAGWKWAGQAGSW